MSKEKVIKVIDIVKEYLKANKLDGLSNMDYPNEDDCCCDLDNLCRWCDGEDVLTCYPGKKVMCAANYDEVDPNNWIIIPYKKD